MTTMKRLAFALALGLASPAAAFDLEAMTDAERDAFRAEIRSYLMDNPQVIMEAVAVLEQREQAAKAQNDVTLAQTYYDQLTKDGHSYVGGNPEGDITIIEFLDYRCGYCKKAFPEVEQLIAADGNIRLIVKEFPILGDESTAASAFAIAVKLVAGDAAYKDMHDTLMAYRGDFSQAALRRLAESYDLDADAIFEQMNGDKVATIINDNRLLGQAMQITGTPTFVVQDQMLRGYVPLAQMQQIVGSIRNDG